MRCALAPALLVCALVVAGCAGGGGAKDEDSAEDFQGVQKQIATTVEDLQDAAKDKNGGRICASLITIAYQRSIAQNSPGKGCSSAVDDAIEKTDPVDYVVKRIRVTGPAAVATVESKTGDDETVATEQWRLERQAGRWKISSTPPSGR